MSKKGAILNTFDKGMVTDLMPERQQPGTYTYGLNLINNSEEYAGVLVNEQSNHKFNLSEVNGDVVGVSHFGKIDQSVMFVSSQGNSSIYILYHEDYTHPVSGDKFKRGDVQHIITDSDFGCSWGFGDCEMMYGEMKIMQPCNERVLYFSSDCDYYRVNIDEVISGRKECIDDCEHFKLFRCVCTPKATMLPVQGGGFIRSGAYWTALQFEDNDGNTTNWFPVEGPVYIESENNIPGEISNMSINIRINDVDPGFDKVNVAIIKQIRGVITSEIIVSRHYSNNSSFVVQYVGDNPDAQQISIDEILNRGKKFIRGSDLFQKDGILYLYGIKQEFNVNYQKYASRIQVDIAEYEVTAETQQLYNLPTLQSGEVYGLVVWLNFCDGTRSRAFHIPNLQRSPVSYSDSRGDLPGSTGANSTYAEAPWDASNVHRRERGENTEPNKNLRDANEQTIDDFSCDETRAANAIDQFAENQNVDDLCTDDIEPFSNLLQDAAEKEANNNQDDPEEPLGQTSSIKEAAKKLYQEGVLNKEQEVFGKVSWDYKKPPRYQPGGNADTLIAEFLRNDNWTDSNGENILSEKPILRELYKAEVYESDLTYPNTCDCDGVRMYPTGNIRHFKIPNACDKTFFQSNHIGFESTEDIANSAMSDTYVRLKGLQFSNVYIPKEEELPKPLCPENPMTFGILERDFANSSIVAKGLLTSTMTGQVRGRTHAMGRHGINSFETVDISIDENEFGRKFGQDNDQPAYLFHSLDTTAQRVPLAVTHLVPELYLFGSGWRYGLYEKGENPEQWFTGKRIDQRGARQAISLFGQQCTPSQEDIRVTGITYAPADTVVTPPVGITYPLNNRYRESSVYLQLSQNMSPLPAPGNGESDASFVGDTLDHFAPITGVSWYVALKRELTAQYGNVDNQTAISTGIRLQKGWNGGELAIVRGITGDTFISFHSFRRTGYVSDKVGNSFVISGGSSDGRTPIWKEDRSICNSPADFNFEDLSIDHWATRLPNSGDVSEAKNWAGLHTVDDNLVLDAQTARERTEPDSDYYYPRVQKTLVVYPGEFRVNGWKRATGEGPQKTDGQVYYPKLKDLALDSSMSVPWPEAYLNRFYVEIEQPSLAVRTKKSIVRAVLALFLPIIGLIITTSLESIPDTVLTTVFLPMLTAYYMYAKDTVFTEDWLNKMFNIPVCKTDDEGGEDYVRVRQFEDNYNRYYQDFNVRNIFDYAATIPSNYNTCVCDECNSNTTREIYYSNRQIPTSIVDSYYNFQANNYSAIPAHAGPVKKLFTESNRFYAHTTDGLWILQYNNLMGDYQGVTAILGKGDLLKEPQQMNDGPVEGSLGLIHRNAAINCNAGYIFVTNNNIVRMFQGSLDVISNAGVSNFFRTNIRFCNREDCVDERQGSDFVLGWDPRYNRILFTKRDKESSWTASYSMAVKAWISYHSYTPLFYLWDQKDMFSVHDNKVWLHHSNVHNKDKSWCVFYDNKYPMVIDFVTRHESGEPFMFQHTMFDTEARTPYGAGYLKGQHIFFDQIAMWGRTQSTGLLPIRPVRTDNPDLENNILENIKDKPNSVEIVYANDQWRINDMQDHVISCNGAVTTKQPCTPQPVIIQYDKNLCKPGNMYERYFFYRLISNSCNNHQMYLKSVITAISSIVE